MARWQEVVDSAPEFAAAVRQRFDAGKHKTLATLRRDGAPRISGIEATFALGELWLASMPGAMKARDLQRDGRFALHSPTVDPPEDDPSVWPGEAKVAGVAAQITDGQLKDEVAAAAGTGGHPAADVPFFRLDLREVVLATIGEPADHMVITLWKPGEDLQVTRRA